MWPARGRECMGGWGGTHTYRERERDVDNKMCNLLTYSKQLNLVSGCWPSGTLAGDNIGLISTVCNTGSRYGS